MLKPIITKRFSESSSEAQMSNASVRTKLLR
jgi:hypothetical protein